MTKKRKNLKKTLLTIGSGYAALLALGYGIYYFSMIQSNEKKIEGHTLSLSENTDIENEWYKELDKEEWSIESIDGLTLKATYLNLHPDSQKIVILAHGLGHAREQMIPWAKIFDSLGFNVLMPDARAHGDSDGSIIGYGWLDRQDYKRWLTALIQKKGDNIKVALLGISMGAAGVMAASTQDLPSNVKLIIEDSGFQSLSKESYFRMKNKYHLQVGKFLMKIINYYGSHFAGYSYYDGNLVQELRENNIPLLMIHGGKDETVPLRDVYALFNADKGDKQLYIDEDAQHISSIRQSPDKYREVVTNFVNKYIDA